MPTLVSGVWALLSIIVAGVCSFSFLQPFWLVRRRPAAISLGMYGYCLRDTRFQVPTQVCGIYGGYFSVSHLPSSSWQAACVLYGGGCAFLCFGALLAILTFCFQRQLDSKIAVFNGYIQTMGVVTMTAALLIFPVGFQSRVVRHYCHNTGMYHTGICELGWAYVLAIIGTALAMFLPYLSQYTDFRLNVVKRRPTYDDGKKVRIVGDKPTDKLRAEPTPV